MESIDNKHLLMCWVHGCTIISPDALLRLKLPYFIEFSRDKHRIFYKLTFKGLWHAKSLADKLLITDYESLGIVLKNGHYRITL